MSPNYPFASKNYDCIYIISQTEWAINKLEVYRFDLGQWDNGCGLSFLEVRDGNNYSSPLIGKFCGRLNDINNPPRSSQNEVWLRYKTHEGVQGNGFVLKYQSGKSSRDMSGIMYGVQKDLIRYVYDEQFINNTLEFHF